MQYAYLRCDYCGKILFADAVLAEGAALAKK